MKGRNILLSGMRGRVGNFVATQAEDGDTILRGMPKTGNQGKDPNHAPAHTRARVVGVMAKRAKSSLRNSFTDRPKGRSGVSMFQAYNMTAANNVVNGDGVVDWTALRVSDGDAYIAGLQVANGAFVGGQEDTVTGDVSWNENANGANIKLMAFVMSTDGYQSKLVDTGLRQDGNGGAISVVVDGYEDPAVYIYWYDEDEKSATPSIYVHHVPA